jgi:glycosyltransferase involved in cell wall biosynthesis
MMVSVVIPVFRNQENIQDLLACLISTCSSLSCAHEVVFVVDGSPDRSEQLLREALPQCSFPSQLVTLSRNFGSFNAIRAGLSVAQGDIFVVIAADLQEPPEIIPDFIHALSCGQHDVCVGRRTGRDESLGKRLPSEVFWKLYRTLVQHDMPHGGLDVFGCNRSVRDVLLSLREANSSLVGQLIWSGFRRVEVPYQRLRRQAGKSGWTFRKKWKYMSDSIYSFTDFPIRLLTTTGGLGMFLVASAAIVIFSGWAIGAVSVAGYTPIMLSILFFSFANFFGLGIVGNYVWRGFENSKQRPLHIIEGQTEFSGSGRNGTL